MFLLIVIVCLTYILCKSNHKIAHGQIFSRLFGDMQNASRLRLCFYVIGNVICFDVLDLTYMFQIIIFVYICDDWFRPSSSSCYNLPWRDTVVGQNPCVTDDVQMPFFRHISAANIRK